jgi:hypothetical protein
LVSSFSTFFGISLSSQSLGAHFLQCQCQKFILLQFFSCMSLISQAKFGSIGWTKILPQNNTSVFIRIRITWVIGSQPDYDTLLAEQDLATIMFFKDYFLLAACWMLSPILGWFVLQNFI